MTPYACFLLLSGILSGLFILHCESAPTSYDQRQEGEFNVEAKFENFLFVFAFPSDEMGVLTTQALSALSAIPLTSENNELKKLSESIVYETEDGNIGKEPYHVEIIHIDKEKDSAVGQKHLEVVKVSGGEHAATTNTEKSEKLVKPEKTIDLSDDGKKDDKKARSLWRNNKSTEKENSAELQNLKTESVKVPQEDLTVKEETLKQAKPGISLKKQLSRKQDEDVTSISSERNEVGSAGETKPQELKLLGGGIENCGPGRYRDTTGVCQEDTNFQ